MDKRLFSKLVNTTKWHTAHINLIVGHVVPIQDSNLSKSPWTVQVEYKTPKPKELVLKYSRRGYVTIERPVNKLVVLLPNDEHRLAA